MPMITIAQKRLHLGDPHDCTDIADTLTVLDGLYDAIVQRDGSGYRPGLAAAWAVSDDARSWRFTLRSGVRFHDGTPCDAAAVAAALARMAQPEMGATLGAPGVWHQYLGGATIVAEAADRLRITLAAPMADLLDVLVYGYVMAPDSLPDPAARPVGTGPWRLAGRDPQRIEAEAVAGHPDARTGRLVWQLQPDPAARVAALAQGAALANDLPAAAQLPDGCTACDYLDPTAIIFLFNAARPAMADPRVRRALNLALDRPALVAQVLGGFGAPLTGFVGPAHPGHVAGLEAPARRAEARRLLAEAGHGAGLTLVADTPSSLPAEAEALTAAVAAQLGEVGVALTVQRWPDREAYAHRVRRSEVADLCVFDSSPMSTFRVLHEKIDSRVQGSWWLGYRNPAVETLIDQACATVDATARTALYRACFTALQQDPPWLFCYQHRKRLGLRGRHPSWLMRPDGVIDVRRLPRDLGDA
jgi:peptide/nickel transport system substrate-binding protein